MLVDFMQPYVVCADIYARADANYYKTTSTTAGITTEATSFNQGYTFGLTKELTSAIRISGDVRLTINETNGEKTEDIYPIFYLNYTPPSMYYMSFSYNRTEHSPPGGNRYATSNMNASFSLPLEKWPSVSFAYNRSTTQDYLDVHKVDSVSTNKNFSTSYGFDVYETKTGISYSYANPITEDKVTNTKSEAQSHNVSANLSRSFWEQKIKTGANIGYNTTKSISESTGAPSRFEQGVAASEGLYAVDATPASGALASAPALIDNNTGASAGIDLNNTDRNIGLKFLTAQALHRINLYISTTEANISTFVNNSPTYFGWQLYTSSDGINWTLSNTPTALYESAYSRIALTFAEVTALYFKIVNTNFPAAALPINVTEMEAVGFVVTTPVQILSYNTVREFGGLNVSFTPVQRIALNYSINYNRNTQDLNNSESTSVSQNSNINAVVIPRYLTLSTSYATGTTMTSQDTATGTFSTETGTDSYGLTLASAPLPTVNASLGYGHTEALTGGETYSTTDSVNGNVFMNLYKGVALSLASTFSESKDLRADSTSSSQGYFANLNLVPWRTLTVIIDSGTSSSTTTGAEGAETSSTTNSLSSVFSFTPTRKLYVSATITVEPSSSQSCSITWLPTRSIQTSVRYGISGNITNTGVDISWTPLSRLSLGFGYSSTTVDNVTNDKSDSIFARVSLRL